MEGTPGCTGAEQCGETTPRDRREERRASIGLSLITFTPATVLRLERGRAVAVEMARVRVAVVMARVRVVVVVMEHLMVSMRGMMV